MPLSPTQTHLPHACHTRTPQTARVALLFCTLAALHGLATEDPAARPTRDPFWPIGYQPPKPVTAPPPAETEPTPPPAPAEKPGSDEDWAEARKTLVVSGYTQSLIPETGERKAHVMINRRTYAIGDTVSAVRQNTRFVWLIESISARDLTLKPLEAAPLSPKSLQQ